VRVVFLDVDGVLTNLPFLRDRPACDVHALDPKNVAALNELTTWTGAKIVISSTWRVKHNLPNLRKMLLSQGIQGDIVGRTPEIPGADRGAEIQTWLDTTKYPIDRFVILDDDSDMGPLKPYLIRTTFSCGLTSDDVRRAARLLLV
jgi:hypothetical protein